MYIYIYIYNTILHLTDCLIWPVFKENKLSKLHRMHKSNGMASEEEI